MAPYYNICTCCSPGFNDSVFPFQLNVPEVLAGNTIVPSIPFTPFRCRSTAMVPSGCGMVPFIEVSSPGAGAIFIFLKPGAAGSMPQMVARKSYTGLALHAWQSERVGSGFSAKVVSPFASISRQGFKLL